MNKPQTASALRCPICDGQSIRRLFAFEGYSIYQCGDCRLRLMHPQPDDATLQRIYSAHYFLGSEEPEAMERTSALKRRTAAMYCDTLIRHLGGSKGRLLEIGCGWGDFLLEARQRGFEVDGLEFSQDAAVVENQRLGAARVKPGILEENSYEPGVFDVVALFDVIEHVRNPRQFVNQVVRLIKPGGLMMIVTPSLDSLSARMLGRHWMEYKVEHLYYFSQASIRRTFSQLGFNRMDLETNRKILDFDYIERHFARFKVPVLSLLLHLARAMCPSSLALRPVNVQASGKLVFAFKG